MPIPRFYNTILLPPSKRQEDACANSRILDTPESKLRAKSSKLVASASGREEIIPQLGLVHRLFYACRASCIQSCGRRRCADFKERLQKLIPSCKDWDGFGSWALQVAACICSQNTEVHCRDDGFQFSALPTVITSMCRDYHGLHPTTYGCETVKLDNSFLDWAEAIELSDVLGILSWLNGINTGRYELVREPIELSQFEAFNVQEHEKGGIFTSPIVEAVERARSFNLCPHRVWALSGSLPGRELNLPALIPPAENRISVPGHDGHDRCTFDFCEESVVNFTSVEQLHECNNRKCGLTQGKFQQHMLNKPALAGEPTAWKLDGSSVIEPTQPFMAISHVWADGTGVGAWRPGEVNECLYGFFRRIAEKFNCDGIWWDTICIPRDPEARNKAINNMHVNYASAKITLVHDRYLRKCEWIDAECASFAIVMSSWYTRGWTALELAKSREVKVIFKSDGREPVIKDLDKDILVRSGEPCSAHRQVATALILNLRKEIADVNGLLTALSPRHTSWQRDRAIISGLLAGVVVPVELKLQEIYQGILKKLAKVSHGHLFHSSATMSKGFSWCPTSLLDIPLATGAPPSLAIKENGDVVGYWGVVEVADDLAMEYVWKDTHPLTKARLQLALRGGDKHLLLVEPATEIITRALLVKVMRNANEERPTQVHCKIVGPVHFRSLGGNAKVGEIEVRIVDTGGMVELYDEKALDYVDRVWEERKRRDANATGEIQIARGSVGPYGVRYPGQDPGSNSWQ